MFEEIYEKYELKDEHELISELIPKGYNVNSSIIDISDIKKYPDKTQVTVYGFIDSFTAKQMSGRKALTRVSAKLYREGQSVSCFWVTSTQMHKKVLFGLEKQTENKQMVQVTGKISSFEGVGFNGQAQRVVQLEQPKLVSVSEQSNQGNSEVAVVVPEPMYKLKSKIKSTTIRGAFRTILKNFNEVVNSGRNEFLPIEVEKELEMQPLKISLEFMHGFKPIPRNKFEDFMNYPGFVKRVSAEKVWSIIKSSHEASNEIAKEHGITEITQDDIKYLRDIASKLPFELTEDQKQTIWEILQVFASTDGSKSLVFGDVGSGKTIVAMFLSYILYKNGFQAVVMTPTSILSKQHFEEFLHFIGEKEDVFLIHSKTKAREKTKINKHLSAGKPAIIVGTTSVNSLELTNVGAVFIDEEQKLGVHAKEKIVKKFDNKPHLVYMTATPIPRTLAASIYTNFHVHQIKTKPKNRLPRQTMLMDAKSPDQNELNMIADRLKQEQGLVIIPSIDSNELANVKDTILKYSRFFPGVKIKAIHGRLDKKEVEEIIESYMNREFEILVATTMVDSGFSNKLLSFVFVENADRFGISQLHQIRGRCGRGELQGHCYLIPTAGKKMKDHTRERLSFVCSSEDGFKLSEFDLKSRGSGDLKGTVQSGTELNLIEWVEEINVMKKYLENQEINKVS